MTTTRRPFEVTSERRKGFLSESHVKKGHRVVHCDKEFTEKLGRNDRCPYGSRRLLQSLLPSQGRLLTVPSVTTIAAEDSRPRSFGRGLFATIQFIPSSRAALGSCGT